MKLEEVLDSGFHKEEGPFVKALDVALASFNVHRQAYYSGTFVGNHVHRTLKVRQFHNPGVLLTKLTLSWLSALQHWTVSHKLPRITALLLCLQQRKYNRSSSSYWFFLSTVMISMIVTTWQMLKSPNLVCTQYLNYTKVHVATYIFV